MNSQPFTGPLLAMRAASVGRHGVRAAVPDAEGGERSGHQGSHGHGRSRSRRLRRERDVREVFDHGHPVHARALSVYAVATDGPTRTTVVAGKKVGGAVRRNRAKRRLRAALQASRLPEGYDVVVVARARCLSMPFTDLRAQLAEQVRRSASGCTGT